MVSFSCDIRKINTGRVHCLNSVATRCASALFIYHDCLSIKIFNDALFNVPLFNVAHSILRILLLH